MFAAARFYELQVSGLGQDFLDKVELALRELVKSPERWPIVQDDTRRRLIKIEARQEECRLSWPARRRTHLPRLTA